MDAVTTTEAPAPKPPATAVARARILSSAEVRRVGGRLQVRVGDDEPDASEQVLGPLEDDLLPAHVQQPRHVLRGAVDIALSDGVLERVDE